MGPRGTGGGELDRGGGRTCGAGAGAGGGGAARRGIGRCRPHGCTAVNWTRTIFLLFAPCLRAAGADGRGGLLEASCAGKRTSASAVCSAAARSGSAAGGCSLAPHSAQNLAAGVLSVPHCAQTTIIESGRNLPANSDCKRRESPSHSVIAPSVCLTDHLSDVFRTLLGLRNGSGLWALRT
eukprot:scaffold11403_cov64-Phaeocystis_antarctica.AAC.2